MLALLVALHLVISALAFFDVDEINNVRYGIDILDTPVMAEQGSDDSLVFLASKFGQQYQCSYRDKNQDSDSREKEEEQVAMEKGIVELLKPMADQSCLKITVGWWTYEFCYGRHIKQYHVEDDTITGEVINLGYYQSDFDWSNSTQQKKTKSWEPRYHTQEYINGTQCDLTGKPRRAQVRFFCQRDTLDYISGVHELETCVYTLSVQTNKICHHPFLKAVTKNKPVPITCQPLLTAEEYEEYQLTKEEEEQEERQKSLARETVKESSSSLESSETSDASDEDGPQMESDEDDLDTATNVLQKLITRSLVNGLSDVLGNEARSSLKVTKLKTIKAKRKDVESIIRDVISEVKGQTNEDDKKAKQVDDSSSGNEQTEDEEDVDDGDGVVLTDDEDDSVVLSDDDDDTLLTEFDKGLDNIIQSEEHLEEVKQYKETVANEMNAQFSEIIREAEDELNEAGFKEEIDKDSTLKEMSKTLEKLLKKLENKKMTENSKEASAGNDEDEELDEDEEHESAQPERSQDSHNVIMKENIKEITDSHAVEEASEETIQDGEDGDDITSLQYEIKYGDAKPDGVSSDTKYSEQVSDHGLEGSLSEAPDEQTRSGSTESGTETDVPEEVKDTNLDDGDDEQQGTPGSSDQEETNDEYKVIVYNKKGRQSNERIRIKVTTWQHDDDDVEQEKDSSSVRDPLADDPDKNSKRDGAHAAPKARSSVLRSAEKHVQEAVQKKLSESGVKLPDHTIQVKIITGDDYYNEMDLSDIFNTNQALNKMLIAVLGSNTDEIVEAKRQDKLSNNYSFVWKKGNKRKPASRSQAD